MDKKDDISQPRILYSCYAYPAGMANSLYLRIYWDISYLAARQFILAVKLTILNRVISGFSERINFAGLLNNHHRAGNLYLFPYPLMRALYEI